MKKGLILICSLFLCLTNVRAEEVTPTESTDGDSTVVESIVETEEPEAVEETDVVEEAEASESELEAEETPESASVMETEELTLASEETEPLRDSNEQQVALDKDQFRSVLENVMSDASEVNLYIGSIDDYSSASTLTQNGTISDAYTVYASSDATKDVYVVSESGKDVVFPSDCKNFFEVTSKSNFKKIKSITFKSINAEAIKNATSMFSKLVLTSTLDLSGFNMKNLMYMDAMFENFEAPNINFNGFVATNVHYLTKAFHEASISQTLDLSSWEIEPEYSTIYASSMFESAKLGGLKMFESSKEVSGSSMFKNAEIKSNLDLSALKINATDALDEINVDGTLKLYECSGGTYAYAGTITAKGDLEIPWDLKEVKFFKITVDITGNLILRNLDVSNCESFQVHGTVGEEVILEGLDFKSLTSTTSMFSSLNTKKISLSNVDLSRVTNMFGMFSGSTISNLDLTGLDTSKVTNMSNMFSSANISNLDLSSFDTSHVTDMSYMFSIYEGTTLDISSFDTSNVTEMNYMFGGGYNLKTIYVSDKFTTKNISDDVEIFGWVENLIGGNGTRLDKSKVYTKKYAVIDTPSTPGYFTLKNATYSTDDFIDVDATTAHVENIAWLASNNISEGWPVGNGLKEFRPYNDVARADMAAFIRRLARKYGVLNAEEYTPQDWEWGTFTDVDKNTPHAEDILWLAYYGISTGWVDEEYGTAEFRPYASVARCDMAAFLRRFASEARFGDAYSWEASDADYAAFSDIDPTSPHAEDVIWLAHAGVSKGWAMKDGTFEFRPLTNVARADMAAFLERLVFVTSD